MSYEDAIGWLVGDEHEGMRNMFTMMNNARLSVGLEGLCVSEHAYQAALGFANQRQQGRAVGAPAGAISTIIEHPDVRRMLMTQRAWIDAMRCSCTPTPPPSISPKQAAAPAATMPRVGRNWPTS